MIKTLLGLILVAFVILFIVLPVGFNIYKEDTWEYIRQKMKEEERRQREGKKVSNKKGVL